MDGNEVTRILESIRLGGEVADEARERLFVLLYGDLRRVAGALMQHEAAARTLQPTAVVHEAYLKLGNVNEVQWAGRAHFLAVAARAMRQVLIDHARARESQKRGGRLAAVSLDDSIPEVQADALEVLFVDDCLKRLAEFGPRTAQVVELRVFGGLTHEEIAEALGVSLRTAAEEWAVGRRWLARELTEREP